MGTATGELTCHRAPPEPPLTDTSRIWITGGPGEEARREAEADGDGPRRFRLAGEPVGPWNSGPAAVPRPEETGD